MQRQQPRRDLGDGGREAACVARYLVCLFFAPGISKTGKHGSLALGKFLLEVDIYQICTFRGLL
jgi:hypothetical protein